MTPFTSHRGIVATLDRANVDTDLIIPKQFLKLIGRTGFGRYLFFDMRYLPNQRPDPAFELNAPHLQCASILVARNNFGCGSSREHAVWAVVQYGFRVVIAPRQERDGARVPAFADIFRNNAVKNGLLTVELTEQEVNEIFALVAKEKKVEATVDLTKLAVTLHGAGGDKVYPFAMDAGARDILLQGLDDISQTLKHEPEIAAFERSHDVQMNKA